MQKPNQKCSHINVILASFPNYNLKWIESSRWSCWATWCYKECL